VSDTRRLYAAEDTLLFLLQNAGSPGHGPTVSTVEFMGSSLTLPVERRFGDLAGVRAYLQEVRRRSWGHPDVPMPGLRVRKGHAKAHWADGTIALPDGIGERGWAMREVVVLHEYAHHVTWHVHGSTGHGSAFQDVYAGLLEHAVGPEAAFVLRVGLAAG
jgi:putative metallohydrolase (TIGR04338 family)